MLDGGVEHVLVPRVQEGQASLSLDVGMRELRPRDPNVHGHRAIAKKDWKLDLLPFSV